MKNNSNYFSHDWNAHEDTKCLELKMLHWLEWYWLYREIIERLFNEWWKLLISKCKAISYQLHMENEKFDSIFSTMLNTWLLESDNDSFWSPSLLKRIEIKNEIRQRRIEAGQKWWLVSRRWKEFIKKDSESNEDNNSIYLVEMRNDEERFVKVWITNDNLNRRLSWWKYKWKTIYEEYCDTTLWIEIETEIEEKYEKYCPKIKFSWYRECYNIWESLSILSKIKQSLSKNNQIVSNKSKLNKSKLNKTKQKKTKKEKIYIALDFLKFKNVFITQEQFDDLNIDYWVTTIKSLITDLSLYIAQKKEDPYTNHYATLLKWIKKWNLKKIKIETTEKKWKPLEKTLTEAEQHAAISLLSWMKDKIMKKSDVSNN